MPQKKDVIRPTDAEAIRLAKTLLRSARHGALAVLDPASGAPLASRVAVATCPDGSPVILVSSLSAHTSGLVHDSRCSLLLGEPGKGDPLAHPRITIACEAFRLERGTSDHGLAERRFLNRHPKAKLYAGFADFSFFRLAPQTASLNGGFGKAYALMSADIMTQSPASKELSESEQGAIEHMNIDHRDALALYARHFARAGDGDWTLVGIDAEGLDLLHGDRSCRVFFPEIVTDARDLRPTLVAMAVAIREAG